MTLFKRIFAGIFILIIIYLLLSFSGILGYMTEGSHYFYDNPKYLMTSYPSTDVYTLDLDAHSLESIQNKTFIENDMFSAKVDSISYQDGNLVLQFTLYGTYTFLGGYVVTDTSIDESTTDHLIVTAQVDEGETFSGKIIKSGIKDKKPTVAIQIDVTPSWDHLTLHLTNFIINYFERQ